MRRASLPKDQEPAYDRVLIYGIPAMAKYCGIVPSTMHKWLRRHEFPAGKLPDGAWCTSTGLIDQWLLARNPLRRGPGERDKGYGESSKA